MRAAILRSLLAAAALCAALAAAAQEPPVSLKDPEDGALDFSAFLSTRTGFLPVPLIVTEPAVGFGGGLFPLFIRRNAPDPDAPEKAFPTPTLFGAGGFGTANGSWGAFGGYLIPLRGDRIRWTGGAAYLDLNLKFFGFGPDSPLQENPVSFDITAPAIFQRVQTRLGNTDLFAGLQYVYLGTKSTFAGALPPEIPPAELHLKVGGLGGLLEYDTRDNFLSPQRGVDVFLDGNAYVRAFGSDVDFGKSRLQAVYYGRLGGPWGFGLRLDANYAWGDVPFFERPALSMRGLRAGRYMDNVALLTEGEARYWIDPRWMVIAFGGVGRVAPAWDDLGSASNVPAGGVGFRYLIARRMGLQAGLDVGFGPSSSRAVYLQVGSAWR